MSKPSYRKLALTYEQQLQQLKQRGLTVENEPRALHLLTMLSYYRLSGYWYPFLKDPKTDHVFEDGASFENAFMLYCFDQELRKLLMTELEKVEVAVRRS